jgi:hypothetical protein
MIETKCCYPSGNRAKMMWPEHGTRACQGMYGSTVGQLGFIGLAIKKGCIA